MPGAGLFKFRTHVNLKLLTRYLWAMCSDPFVTGLSAWERLWEAMVMPHPFLSHSSTPVLTIPQSCLEDVTACSINPNSFCSQHYVHFVLKALRQNKLLCLQRLSENVHPRNHADTRKCGSTRGRWVGQGPAMLYEPPCSISLCSRGPLIECGELSFFFCLFLFLSFLALSSVCFVPKDNHQQKEVVCCSSYLRALIVGFFCPLTVSYAKAFQIKTH